MDPLSIASGVAGLVTLADVVISRTYNTIIACKHASEDSRKLLREVQALAGILQSLFSLESKLGTAALQSHIPAAQILACQQTLQNIRDKLEKSDPKEDGISIFQKVKRTLKWPLSSSDTEKVLTEMERHKSTFDLALSVDALEAILSSQQAEKDIDSKIDGVAETLDKLSRIEVTKERRRLLQLVGAEDADGIHRDNLKIHQLGTGLWFLEPGKPFRTWQTAACSKLWVHGIPGAGKTILSALAIEQVAQTASTFHGMIFYYCSHREEKSRQLTGILGSFIGQLARQDEKCMAILEDKCGVPDYTASQAWMSDVDDLLIVLRKMLRRFQDISVLIDGVDECHEATLVTDTLASIVANTPGCRMLVFSRKEAEMEPLLEGFDQLSIAAESQDLRLYVPAQIEARTRLRKLRIRNPSVKDKIIEALVNEADGMFRWVSCQLDHLCDLTTDEERLSALKKLPHTLESTYDRILERVNDRGESACLLVQRSLLWVVHSGTPPNHQRLSLRQLCEAVSIDTNTTSLEYERLIDVEEILIGCSSLVRLASDGNSIESAHFTVEEYLRAIDPDRKPHLARFHLRDDRANTYKGETCLTRILFDDITTDVMADWASLLNFLWRSPFYHRAALAWPSFSRGTERTELIETLSTRLFLSPKRTHYTVWAQFFVLCDDVSHGHSISSFISTFPPCDGDVDSMASTRSDLYAELCMYPDASPWGPDYYNSTWARALGVVAMSSEIHFAALLAQEHLLAPLAGLTGNLDQMSVLGTPLHCALIGPFVLHGRNDSVFSTGFPTFSNALSLTVTTILDLGADINIDFVTSGGNKVTTSHVAACNGRLEEILAAGANLDRKTADWLYKYGAPRDFEFLQNIDISKVAQCDQPAFVRLLQKAASDPELLRGCLALQTVAFTDGQNKLLPEYRDVLITACRQDDLPAFRWMVERSGISVDYLINSQTPLHIACSWSSTTVATYLIANGSDVNVTDSEGVTPLGHLLINTYASDRSPMLIMASLLESGVSVNGLHKAAATSLMCWAERRCFSASVLQNSEEILTVLLSRQVSCTHCNEAGQNAWHILAANEYGHDLVKLLKAAVSERDILTSFDVVDTHGLSPLHVAAQNGHGQTMQELIDLGCRSTLRTPNGKTILHLAMGALSLSRLPLQIAAKVEWDSATKDADSRAAFNDCIESLCSDHDTVLAVSKDMPDHIRAIMIELRGCWVASTEPVLDYAHCITVMARHFDDMWTHRSAICKQCDLCLQCFVLLLRGPSGKRVLDKDDLASLHILCNGLQRLVEQGWSSEVESTTCGNAICAVLESALPGGLLQASLKKSTIVETVIRARQPEAVNALLKLDIDVDSRDLCSDGLTILQLLCQASASATAVQSALSRTKTLHDLSHAGDTLLHLVLRGPYKGLRPSPSCSVREAIVQLLIEAGIDLNASSLGETALMLSTRADQFSTPRIFNMLIEHGASTAVQASTEWDTLLYACIYGHEESVRTLLSARKPFEYGRYLLSNYRQGANILIGPFQAAVFNTSDEVLKMLYEHTEVEVDVEDRLGIPSSLWLACAQSSNLERIQYLLRKGSDVHRRCPHDGTTPLHAAAIYGSVAVVETLLKAGSNIHEQDDSGLTAEIHAMLQGHRAVAEILQGAALTTTANEPTSSPQRQFARSNLRHTSPSALADVIINGNIDALESFISAGGNPRSRFTSCECTPMIIALIYGKAKIVKLLQSLGINPIGEACDAHFAHDPGELFFTTSLGLLSAQPILNESLECFLADYACAITPHAFVHMMHSAAGNGNIDALQLLLNVNRPMQDLLLMQHPDIRIYRVEYGQWFPYLTTSGTVLHTAVLAGRIEIVKLLLQHQSDPDVLDAHGRPASHIAAWIGRADILELLLSHGCEVDARDSYLQTTLGSAVGFGHVEVVRVLLDRHADLTASKDRGVCLIQTAISCGNPAVFFLLADAGLEPTSEDICSWYKAGNWQVLMSGNHMERLAVMPEFLQTPDTGPEMKAVLNITPPHYRKLNLTCRVMIMNVRNSVLYRASTLDDLEAVILLHNAGAMLNLDGGAEGTPLMGACKAGRLGVVKYLVRHGAILNYEKHGVPVSAFDKAASYPKIQRWLLVERFTEQRLILDGETPGEQAADMEEGDTWTDEIAEVTLDLVLEDDVEQYLESKNWFLPMRRFVDDGQGAFVRVPILQTEFARYRPLDFKVSPK